MEVKAPLWGSAGATNQRPASHPVLRAEEPLTYSRLRFRTPLATSGQRFPFLAAESAAGVPINTPGLYPCVSTSHRLRVTLIEQRIMKTIQVKLTDQMKPSNLHFALGS
jgi:hypothetical protein